MDDASIIIIDLLPTEGTSFPTVALKANPKGSEKPGGLCAEHGGVHYGVQDNVRTL
jgi:hypothetical protein